MWEGVRIYDILGVPNNYPKEKTLIQILDFQI